jgi:hypothetical protein
MFVHYSPKTDASYKAIAMLVAVALFMWMIGAQFVGKTAQAANVTQFSDLLSESAPSTASNHTITFTTPNGMTIGQNFTVTFESPFDTSLIDTVADVDLRVGGVDQTLAGAAGAGTWGVTGFTTDTLTFTTPTDGGVASSTQIIIEIGTHATFGATGDDQIVNPSATSSYTIDIDGTMQDSGQTQVAIVENVLVTAAVETTFEFTVSGLPSGVAVNGSPTTTSTTTTSTLLPFGTLVANVSKTLAQRLNVLTNARNGFVVTVEQSQDLQSSTGAVIDSFTNGTYVNTPTAWTGPSNSISDNRTWGHWGLTSEDNLNTDEFGTNLWVAASTTPRQIFQHASSSDGVTANIGSTTVGYQVQITALQEAGNDYNTTLTYIATPTF